MKCVNKKALSMMSVPSMKRVNWQLFSFSCRNFKLPEIALSDLHYAADGLHHDFPSIKRHAGSALIDFLQHCDGVFLFLTFPFNFSSEFIDIGAIVHHSQVNYKAAN